MTFAQVEALNYSCELNYTILEALHEEQLVERINTKQLFARAKIIFLLQTNRRI